MLIKARRSLINTAAGIFVAGLLFLSSSPVFSQQEGVPIAVPEGAALAPPPPPPVNGAEPTPTVIDPLLTTHEAAVECAMALIVKAAQERNMPLSGPPANNYKAGLCAGKLQTYMLSAIAEKPDCFPKLEIEDAMRLFVKWTEAHPEEGGTLYSAGFRKAFEDFEPCLKK